jgi:two-component system OmpR family sensor kinase
MNLYRDGDGKMSLGGIASIRVRVALVFVFLFILVIVLGLESLSSLKYVNDVAAQVRVRWLPSTRALGDLNNFTTDFPAAAAALLRAQGAVEKAVIQQQMATLDRRIDQARRSYDSIPHDTAELALFRQFSAAWQRYRAGLPSPAGSLAGPSGGADQLYVSANATLLLLTARNEASAARASFLSDVAYRQARTRILLTILLAAGLVIGATIFVTRSISAPLVDLARRMRRLASSETQVDVIGTSRPDEIGEMARAVVIFRNNAIELANSRHTLAEQAAVLEQKLLEEQQLTRVQRNFVSMASHEFRTPLAIIDGHAQRLCSARDRMTLHDLAERSGKIRIAVQRMTQLIDNLIGSARLIDGEMGVFYEPTEIDVGQLLREGCQLQRDITPEAGIEEHLGQEPLIVQGDSTLLRQVISNLLSNAVKYSPDGGRIRVSGCTGSSMVTISVEDQGIGIPKVDRVRVFERYYRGSNTAGIGGTGLGLHLVKTIVEMHGGTILLECPRHGGTRFVVRLRAYAAPRELPARLPSRNSAGVTLVY